MSMTKLFPQKYGMNIFVTVEGKGGMRIEHNNTYNLDLDIDRITLNLIYD